PKIPHSLSQHLTTGRSIASKAVKLPVKKPTSPDTEWHGLEKAIQNASDVCDALAMVVQMLDAAYDQTLDADPLRCLLEPLQQKLSGAIDEMRLAS
ncbi:DUF1484 family protein, partial [Pseudomonas typographi]